MPAIRHTNKAATADTATLVGALRDSLGCGVLVVGGEGRILSCTPGAEHVLRLPPGQAVGAPLSKLPAPVQKIIRDAGSTQRAMTRPDVKLFSGPGISALEISALPCQSSQSDPHIVVVLNDTDVARRLELNIARLDRLASLGTLSAGMALE